MVRQVCIRLILLLLLLHGANFASEAAERDFAPDQVKAVFLYNLTHFVTWPPNELGLSDRPFTFCVLGNRDIAAMLTIVLEGEKVVGRDPVVVSVAKNKAIPPCQLLFIDQSIGEQEQAEILAQMHGHAVLVTGDREGFCEQGGGVFLGLQKNKISLSINKAAIDQQHLQVSSRLLQVAKVVSSRVAP
jgi:hypothetical protein